MGFSSALRVQDLAQKSIESVLLRFVYIGCTALLGTATQRNTWGVNTQISQCD